MTENQRLILALDKTQLHLNFLPVIGNFEKNSLK